MRQVNKLQQDALRKSGEQQQMAYLARIHVLENELADSARAHELKEAELKYASDPESCRAACRHRCSMQRPMSCPVPWSTLREMWCTRRSTNCRCIASEQEPQARAQAARAMKSASCSRQRAADRMQVRVRSAEECQARA